MIFDFTPDFYMFDNLQSLILRATGQSDVTIPKALNPPADWSEAEKAAGNVLEGDKIWTWPVVSSTTRPPLGSILVDADGVSWTILSVTKKALINTWEAHCRCLSIVYGLNNLANVLKASYTKSAGGEAVPAWTQILTGISARFQPAETEAQILEDAEWPKTTYHVFLGTDIFAPEIPVMPASADYRLVDAAGQHYRIMQYQRAERIDALPLAVCVLIIEGSEGGATDRISSSSSSSSGH